LWCKRNNGVHVTILACIDPETFAIGILTTP
jgi:hypothetical protein